jgi:PPOX class probable F420-dependent enzyme
VDAAAMRHRLADARVATLGTVDAQGRPHVVPVCFAWTDDGRLVTAVDHKPKRTTALARLAHVRANPAVTVLAHHYEEDWSALWWVRVDGTAVVVDDPRSHPELVDPLVAKYPAYVDRPPAGPAIVVTVERWQGWSASPD